MNPRSSRMDLLLSHTATSALNPGALLHSGGKLQMLASSVIYQNMHTQRRGSVCRFGVCVCVCVVRNFATYLFSLLGHSYESENTETYKNITHLKALVWSKGCLCL